MEAKKNPKVELANKYSLFLNIGLVISLALCLAAFEWKTYDDLSGVDIGVKTIEPEVTLVIPITDLTPPPPPKVQPEIIEVKEEEIEEELAIFETEITPETIIAPPTLPIEKAAEPIQEEDTEGTFIVVENPPMPEGGFDGFGKYLQKNLKYPEQARRMNVEGKVFVQFVIDKDGSPTDITVLKGIGSGCDEEAVRVIKNMPKWTPGKQRGRPVKVKMSLPVVFKLG
ncbi:TonB family protein [Rhodocytophaga aerolata]|uniref:TonB family protein n=1 Tax=Rhodocytophaga aerolata TaxID=455078 RepID=A0ABT8R0J4_9BACT|nr:energy transducer TonB [Rhodocytophaga aerolata]MDO1444778.1 TonB family protein [Rhodocytophaga aerolata]